MSRTTITAKLIRVGSAKRLTRSSSKGALTEPLNPVERYA